MERWCFRPVVGTLSRFTVSSGMIDFHVGGSMVKLCPGEGGGGGWGVNSNTTSVHFLNSGSGMCSFHPILARNVLSLKLISQTFRPDILLQALAE